MPPILDSSVVVNKRDEIKYVRVGPIIALHNEGEYNSHDSIARNNFPGVKRIDGKPVVDDTGTVTQIEGRLVFAGMPPISCIVEGDLSKAREKTKEIAISILGPERVG